MVKFQLLIHDHHGKIQWSVELWWRSAQVSHKSLNHCSLHGLEIAAITDTGQRYSSLNFPRLSHPNLNVSNQSQSFGFILNVIKLSRLLSHSPSSLRVLSNGVPPSGCWFPGSWDHWETFGGFSNHRGTSNHLILTISNKPPSYGGFSTINMVNKC